MILRDFMHDITAVIELCLTFTFTFKFSFSYNNNLYCFKFKNILKISSIYFLIVSLDKAT